MLHFYFSQQHLCESEFQQSIGSGNVLKGNITPGYVYILCQKWNIVGSFIKDALGTIYGELLMSHKIPRGSCIILFPRDCCQSMNNLKIRNQPIFWSRKWKFWYLKNRKKDWKFHQLHTFKSYFTLTVFTNNWALCEMKLERYEPFYSLCAGDA